jgi:hypothetical protein
MTNDYQRDERRSKKEIGVNDFNHLTIDGILGHYKECELTHIFIVEKDSNSFHHYFAVLSYEEFKEFDKNRKESYLTKSLIKINNKYKMGISQMRITLQNASDIFNQLCFGFLNVNGTNFIISNNIQLLPKTHVPTLWGYDGVMLNKVLKPNFWGDKYILEFTAIENSMNNLFSAEELRTINAEILKVIQIDLSSVYDRIGSFIFQFPITLISGNALLSDDWCKAIVSISAPQEINYQKDLFCYVRTTFDDVVTGFHCHEGVFENIELNLGDSNNLEFKIFNRTNGLIYKNSMVNYLRSFNSNFGIGSSHSEPRIFSDSNGTRIEKKLLSYSMAITVGESISYDTRTNKRILQNEIIRKSGRFLNLHDGQREKALIFIRKAIDEKAPTCSEVWLWDPFLRQPDIFDTLYFIENQDILMKCITSFKKNKRQENETCSFEQFKEKEKNNFLNNSVNNLGINLELRVVHENFGFDFHDRFLFLIPIKKDEMPTVYSLGTSINSLGKTHHLIQQSLDPRNIVESFKELWMLLDNKESVIIKLPEDINER